MKRALIAVALCVLGCSDDVQCKSFLAFPGLTVGLDWRELPQDGDYVVSVDADGAELEFRFTQSGAYSEILGPQSTTVAVGDRTLHGSFPGSSVVLYYDPDARSQDVGPRDVTVTVALNGVVIERASFKPTYWLESPQGEGCKEVMRARETVSLP